MRINTNDELLELFEDYNSFNAFINSVKEEIKQELLMHLPDIIIKHSQDQFEYKKVVDKFYSNNPEFKDNKELLKKVMVKITSEHPGMGIKEVFELTAKEVQKILGGSHGSGIQT